MTLGRPGSFFPAFHGLIPVDRLNTMVESTGIRLGWMKSHVCPCTLSGDTPGAGGSKACLTCEGRGTYWDGPPVDFTGLITSSASDEPGDVMDNTLGPVNRAEPTLTVPSSATDVWTNSGEMDAYVEYDAMTRRQTPLKVGERTALPYPFRASVTSVTAYDPATRRVVPVSPVPAEAEKGVKGYTVSLGNVKLTGFGNGTAYAVEYTSSPVYVAHRRAGGLPHRRPFGLGLSLPLRYHLADLDLWTRSRTGQDGPQGLPNALLAAS